MSSKSGDIVRRPKAEKEVGAGDAGGDKPDAKLEKSVGLVSAVALIVGTMIGSGIFISPTGVLKYSGSVASSLLVWFGCGILSLLGALVYAELGSSIPLSGGEHSYYSFTYNRMWRVWGQVPAFIYSWVGVFIIRPVMFAVISLSLGTYATKPFYGDCEPPMYVKKLATATGMVIITFINCYSVKAATHVQNIFTAAKLMAVGVITFGGFYMLGAGNTDTINEGFEDSVSDPSLVALAFYNGLWAYDGWNNLNFVTEELKNPSRNLPLAIGIGIPLTAVCYVLTNIGYFAVLTRQEILVSPAVAVLWGSRLLGVMAWIIPLFVVMSCAGASNGVLFSSGRLCYVSAREGHLPRILSFIHTNWSTPMPALIFTTMMAIIFLIPGDISTLIDFYGFITWLVYGFSSLTLLVLRRSQPKLNRPYQVPYAVPIVVLIASCYLVIAPVINNPAMSYLYAVLFILLGIVVYFVFISYKLTPKFMDKVTRYLQYVLNVVP